MNYLKRLEYLKNKLKKANITYQTKPIEDIENALKRLEELEEEKQSFDRAIEKKLKALEIIKEKRVNVDSLLDYEDYQEYYESMEFEYDFDNWGDTWEYWSKRKLLTPEEYDLLKEIML